MDKELGGGLTRIHCSAKYTVKRLQFDPPWDLKMVPD